MAGEADMSSWADLLHSSTQLLQAATPSTHFPPIQRSLDQLEALSRKLKAKTSRLEAPSQAVAATRLLAREGINVDQLTRDLRSFELKTSFEDVFPVEATSVEEYLQQVHEMIMLSAIQVSQKANLKNFDRFMMRTLEDDWLKEKHDFFNNLTRLPLTRHTAITTPHDCSTYDFKGRNTQVIGRHAQASQDVESMHQAIVDRKALAYSEVVSRLNVAREHGMPFKTATAFKAASDSLIGIPASQNSVNMGKIWSLLQSLLYEDVEIPTNMSKKMAMIIGARRHLEAGHEKHIFDTIQSYPVQAALGGSTSNLHRIRAFLRVRLRDYGALDFDVHDARRQPPLDTTWHQIYYCLRTGYYKDAILVAESSRVGRAFVAQLSEWIAKGGMVSAGTAVAATEECERMSRLGDRSGGPGYDKKKMLLYAILSSSRQQIERLLRNTPTLFTTIEDFLWFQLAVVHDIHPDSSSMSVEGITPYMLEDLQSYLLKFEPAYYSKNGKSPLVYPYILLLSLQFHGAIVYLTKESGGEGYNVDGLHIAIAVSDYGVLLEGFAGIKRLGVMDTVTEIANIIRHYGLSYVRRGNLVLALEYYVQAAATVGGGAKTWSGQATVDRLRQQQIMLKQLLTEVLLLDGGIALLLGSTGTGCDGALGRFYHDQSVQHQFLLEAARQCQDSGMYSKAVELLKRIGAYSMALEMVNKRLSESINAMVKGKLDSETKVSGLIVTGNDIIETFKTAGDISPQERTVVTQQQTALRQFETIFSFHRHVKHGRYSDAIRELSKLSFLPLDAQTSDRSGESLQNISPAIQACIPDLLKSALTCLDNVPDADGSVRLLKKKIANFVVNSLSKNWPIELYEKVAQIL